MHARRFTSSICLTLTLALASCGIAVDLQYWPADPEILREAESRTKFWLKPIPDSYSPEKRAHAEIKRKESWETESDDAWVKTRAWFVPSLEPRALLNVLVAIDHPKAKRDYSPEGNAILNNLKEKEGKALRRWFPIRGDGTLIQDRLSEAHEVEGSLVFELQGERVMALESYMLNLSDNDPLFEKTLEGGKQDRDKIRESLMEWVIPDTTAVGDPLPQAARDQIYQDLFDNLYGELQAGRAYVRPADCNGKSFYWAMQEGRLIEMLGQPCGVIHIRASGEDVIVKASRSKYVRAHFKPALDSSRTTSEEVATKAWKDSPRLVPQGGHLDFVLDAAFSPDGKIVATGGKDKTLKLWDENGRVLQSIQEPDQVAALAYQPRGNLLAEALWNTNIKVRDRDGKLVREIKQGCAVRKLAFSGDGKGLLAACACGHEDADRNTFKVWDLEGKVLRAERPFTRKSYSPLESTDLVDSLAVSPDGALAAVSTEYSATVKLLSLRGGPDQELVIPADKQSFGGTGRVMSLAFSPDSSSLAVEYDDSMVRLWALADRRITGDFKIESTGFHLLFTGDGRELVFGDNSGTLVFRDLQGKKVRTLAAHPKPISALEISPDGQSILTASWDQTARLWSRDGALVKTLGSNLVSVEGASFFPKGDRLAVSGEDSTLRLFRADGELVRSVPAANLIPAAVEEKKPAFDFSAMWAKPPAIIGTQVSKDGKRIAAIARNTVVLWSGDGVFQRTLKPDKGASERPIYRIAFSPDSRLVAAGRDDGRVDVWTVDGQKQASFDAGHPGGVMALTFNPKGDLLATGGGLGMADLVSHEIKLWDTAGKKVKELSCQSGQVSSLAFSPDGKLLAAGEGNGNVERKVFYGQVEIFEIASGTRKSMLIWPQPTWYVGDNVGAVAFSPDSQTLAVGSCQRGAIFLWHPDGALKKVLTGHDACVRHLEYAPDGKHLLSLARDGVLKLWEVESKEQATLAISAEDWLLVTPDGIFDSSKNGGGLLGITQGTTSYGVDQFAVRNNRPDLLLKRLGLGTDELRAHYRAQFEKRLRRMGLKEANLKASFELPTAEIQKTEQSGKQARVSFRLAGANRNLTRYNLYVNDVPIFGAYGKEVTGWSAQRTETVELGSGPNKIEVSCFDETGAESYRALTQVSYEGAARGDLYFLGFGVSRYQNAEYNLGFAHKDARNLSQLFSAMKGRSFDEVKTLVFTDDQVTPEAIKSAKEFVQKARVDDTFVLFIAGHGMYSGGPDARYYYLTHGADADNLQATAADFELVEDLLQGIPPRKKLFLIDTCESGELEDATLAQLLDATKNSAIKSRAVRAIRVKKATSARARRPYLHETDRYIYNDLIRRSGAIVFSSSRGGELSYESEQIQNGFFTAEIVKALTTDLADQNKDGTVSVDELRAYVEGSVPKLTRDAQHPTVDRDNLYQKFGFPLAKGAQISAR